MTHALLHDDTHTAQPPVAPARTTVDRPTDRLPSRHGTGPVCAGPAAATPPTDGGRAATGLPTGDGSGDGRASPPGGTAAALNRRATDRPPTEGAGRRTDSRPTEGERRTGRRPPAEGFRHPAGRRTHCRRAAGPARHGASVRRAGRGHPTDRRKGERRHGCRRTTTRRRTGVATRWSAGPVDGLLSTGGRAGTERGQCAPGRPRPPHRPTQGERRPGCRRTTVRQRTGLATRRASCRGPSPGRPPAGYGPFAGGGVFEWR
ncbi:hypothetical protein SAMN05216532_5550 [Streptomyces sp. 2231.1]|nr:hypothetical protein SAMN05216532_5550 [Streptomyces sp. 2231.1]